MSHFRKYPLLTLLKENIIEIDLDFTGDVIAVLFAFFDINGNCVNCLTRYSISIGDNVTVAGDKDDALVYNKIAHHLNLPRDIDELPIGAIFLTTPDIDNSPSEWNFTELRKKNPLTLLLGVNYKSTTVRSIRCLALWRDTLSYMHGGLLGIYIHLQIITYNDLVVRDGYRMIFLRLQIYIEII
jgi:hypothetical protein